MKGNLAGRITLLTLVMAASGVAGVALLGLQGAEELLRTVAPQSDPQVVAQAVSALRMRMALAALLGLGVLGLAAVLAVRAIVLPVEAVTQQAQRLAEGETAEAVPCLGDGETEALTVALERIRSRLTQSEAALAAQTRTLEEQVKQRTREVEDARDQALAASQAKSLFMATMSHEIRTPMNVVLGMLELLGDLPLEHERREQLRLAYGSGKTLMALIDNVLDFAKIEADRLTLDEMDFDLRALVDESALTLATLAHTREIELTPFFPHSMPTAVRGDINRLRQIFTNLLGNAIKFTPEGGSVELYGGPVGLVPGNRIEYLFEVRDTGPGVPVADRERIFEQFAQGEHRHDQGYSGSGLGLAISKRLVEMMGGAIGVEENLYAPSGSVFHFTVHLGPQANPRVEEGERGAFPGLRVLGVGVDGLQRHFLEDVFELFNARFSHVSEVETALEQLKEARNLGKNYDLVLLNQKPGGDIRQICLELRHAQVQSRFVLLTDLMDQGWDRAAELPGAAICLKKPVSAERLRSAIEWVLKARPGERPLLAAPKVGVERRPVPLRYDGSVLVVDDHAANLTVAKGMLIRLGCDPSRLAFTAVGRDAVRVAETTRFDLILMDCQMPGIDGFEASRLIRAKERERGLPETPIVAFTANVSLETREQGEASGMNDFVAKPVTLRELQTILERFLPLLPLAGELTDGESALTPDAPEPMLTDEPPREAVVEEPEADLSLLLGAMEAIGLPEDDFKDVAGLLANQIPELLVSLERNLKEGDYETARATAHVLKGSMANTIFPQLQAHTWSLYDKIKQKAWKDAEVALGEVRRHFAPVQKAIALFLDETEETGQEMTV
nr:Sensor protein [uncultured bacterium]